MGAATADLVGVAAAGGCEGGEVGLELGFGLDLRRRGLGESGSSVMMAIVGVAEEL